MDIGRDGLRTAEVAVSTGYSVQQIRNLEALGVIKPAPRAANGYRRFGAHHVRDLHTYRDLATAVGPVVARRTMRTIRTSPPGDAAALLCSLHTGLNHEQEEALAAQRALRAIHAEAGVDAEPAGGDAMTITELAGALGVRTSTLRFWEKSGLVTPERIGTKTTSARRYPLAAIREARITAALRAAGYRIPEIHRALAATRESAGIHAAIDTLDRRLHTITDRMLALLRTGNTLSETLQASGQRSSDNRVVRSGV